MTEVGQRRSVAVAVERGDKVGRAQSSASSSVSNPACADVPVEVLDRRALVARRVDGVEAHQLLEQLGRLALELIGVIEPRLSA